jgi:hypothetical protein
MEFPVNELKTGSRIRRRQWSPGVAIELVPEELWPTTLNTNLSGALIWLMGKPPRERWAWVPTHEDLLADDWELDASHLIRGLLADDWEHA